MTPALQEDHDRIAGERFAAYCEAAQIAQASLRLEDGIKAGKAWAKFLNAFLAPPPISAAAATERRR